MYEESGEKYSSVKIFSILKVTNVTAIYTYALLVAYDQMKLTVPSGWQFYAVVWRA